MAQTSEELTHLLKAVETQLDEFNKNLAAKNTCSSNWQRSEGWKSKVVRINKRMKDGDLMISAALVKLALPAKEEVDGFIQHLKTNQDKLPLPVKDVYIHSKGFLSINLQRTLVIQKTVSEVITEGENYGYRIPEGARHDVSDLIWINNSSISPCNVADVDLSTLRCILFADHLKNVLKKLGFTVHEVKHDVSSKINNILQTFQMPHSSEQVNQSTRTKIVDKFKQKATFCKYRVYKQNDVKKETESQDDNSVRPCVGPNAKAESEMCSCGNQMDKVESDSQRTLGVNGVCLDLRQFVMDSPDLQLGKGNYDKMIELAKVTNEDGSSTFILEQCIELEESIQQVDSQVRNKVYHIATKAKEFHQQQVDLTWRIISDTASFSQLHAVCGYVTIRQRSNQDMTVEEFYRIREAQTREASVMKYGDEVQGAGWDDVIRNLTIAGIKFELLGMQLNNQIKLDVSDTRENTSWPDSRDGVFVMYNYARLATLFANYEREVQNGVYPSLPAISSIDFSLLREDLEWGLVFNYILQYPLLLRDIYDEVMDGTGLKVNLQTHKICGFLVSLSRDLSSYYSHVHILGGNQAHLQPMMFARLYLMKAIQQILTNGLGLLGITPLQQM